MYLILQLYPNGEIHIGTKIRDSQYTSNKHNLTIYNCKLQSNRFYVQNVGDSLHSEYKTQYKSKKIHSDKLAWFMLQ